MTKSWASRRAAPAERKGDLREREILDATEKLLATRGYADMTVGDIAEAAGMTRGALYFYFASKQDVLIALVTRTVQFLQEKSGAAAADTAPVEEVIATALETDRSVVARARTGHARGSGSRVHRARDRPVVDGRGRRVRRCHRRRPRPRRRSVPAKDPVMPRRWGVHCAG